MRRDGCPPGLIPYKGTCKKLDIPRVGTGKVLNIQNHQGCSAFGWDWDDHRNICLMEDGLLYGMTAPIKGAVFYWNINEAGEYDPKRPQGMDGYIMGALNTDTSQLIYFDGPYQEGELADLPAYLRESTLDIAEGVRDGNAGNWGLSYFTPDGQPASPLNPDAVVADKQKSVIEAYKIYEKNRQFNMSHRKPFAIVIGRQ